MKRGRGNSIRNSIKAVDKTFPDLKFMKNKQAKIIREIVRQNNLRNLLELGTYQGKGTAYMAAILEERRGPGTVTTFDREKCLELSPNVNEVITTMGLEHRVKINLHHRSFTFPLMKMLEANPRPQFDFCYFDGGHTWDETGFAFLLVDKLLKPGAWIILDDLDWTIWESEKKRGKIINRSYSDEEKKIKQVRKVWEILVKEADYINMRENEFGWGIAQKPYSKNMVMHNFYNTKYRFRKRLAKYKNKTSRALKKKAKKILR